MAIRPLLHGNFDFVGFELKTVLWSLMGIVLIEGKATL